jgi:hypothetical protein
MTQKLFNLVKYLCYSKNICNPRVCTTLTQKLFIWLNNETNIGKCSMMGNSTLTLQTSKKNLKQQNPCGASWGFYRVEHCGKSSNRFLYNII